MHNHYYDEDGVYLCSAPANPGSLPPANAIRQAPLSREGFWPVLAPGGGSWIMKPDHRGKKGWVNGQEVVITHPGALPEGWTEIQPVEQDTRNAEAKRRDDFARESDSLLWQVLAYGMEAEAWKGTENTEQMQRAETKYRAALARYLEKKKEIRLRHPSPDVTQLQDASENHCSSPSVAEENADGKDEPLFYLTSSGAYHTAGCRYTNAAGEWLSLRDIMETGRKIKPCSLCRPHRPEA